MKKAFATKSKQVLEFNDTTELLHSRVIKVRFIRTYYTVRCETMYINDIPTGKRA